ncbi:hypothetical protein ACJZ2D_005711 [Fusarium nematophilum]
MAVLGKRKARAELSVSEEDAAAIFRRHFEAQFSPLPSAGKKTKPAKSEVEDDEEVSEGSEVEEQDGGGGDEGEGEDEWGGFSDDESSEEEEGISFDDRGGGPLAHTNIQANDNVKTRTKSLHGASQKGTLTTSAPPNTNADSVKSSRPPDQTSRTVDTSTSATIPSSISTLPEDAPSLLAQDLELRRLLSESHLLAPALTAAGTTVAPKAFAAGRTRHKATDLRVQALGSKVSIHKQEKMPMNMRKGIVAAAGARETKRRREAKENGIILERETGKKKRRDRGRDPAVDRPGVGRLKGAELRLSDRDVRSIEGGRDAFGRRGKR